jgi:hypothetical protein
MCLNLSLVFAYHFSFEEHRKINKMVNTFKKNY